MTWILVMVIFCTGCKATAPSADSSTIQFGTLILIGLSSDGFIMAADSRIIEMGTDTAGNAIARRYRNNCEKIYFIEHIAVAMAGNLGEEGRLEQGIDTFKRKHKAGKDNVKIFFDFKNALTLPQSPLQLDPSGATEFYSAVFEKEKPFILGYSPFEGDWIAPLKADEPKGFICSSSDPEIKKIVDEEFVKKYTTKQIPSKLMAKVFEKIIFRCTKIKAGISGPVAILKINFDNTKVWLQNDFTSKPYGTLPITVTPKDSAFFNQAVREQLTSQKK